MSRRRRTRIAFRFYVLLFVATCLLGYGVYIAIDSLVQRNAIIESGDMGNQYAAQAVIMRNEKLTDAEGINSINYFADEGGFVFKGNKIAEIYSTAYSQTDVSKLLSIRSEIKSYHKQLRESVISDTQLERIEAQILEYARELEVLIHGREQGNLLNLERQLQSALNSRQAHIKLRNLGDQNLTDLYENESTLLKKIEIWTSTYLAEADCIVSFYTDGYENVLNVENFDEISASQVRSILNGEEPALTSAQRGRIAAFREVRPSGWYLLLISHDTNWNPVKGQSYKVQLAGFDDHIVDATVSSYARSGTELLVRMVVSGDVRPVLNVRTAQAEIGETYVSGLKVPLNAIHAQGGQIGVVLVKADGNYFVPVQVITQDDTHAVIQSIAVGALEEGQKVRVF